MITSCKQGAIESMGTRECNKRIRLKNDIVFNFLKVVVDKKTESQMIFTQERSAREEIINTEITAISSHFNSEFLRHNCLSSTTLIIMKSRYKTRVRYLFLLCTLDVSQDQKGE